MHQYLSTFTLLEVTYLDAAGTQQIYRCGAREFERTLEMVTEEVGTDVQLLSMLCNIGDGWFPLPTEAFKKDDRMVPLSPLEREWNKLIYF